MTRKFSTHKLGESFRVFYEDEKGCCFCRTFENKEAADAWIEKQNRINSIERHVANMK